jgi:hypothetical protein
MNPTCDKDYFFLLYSFEVSNGDQFDIVSAWGLSEGLSLEDRVEMSIICNVKKIFIKHSEGVWRTVSKISDIIFFLKVKGK